MTPEQNRLAVRNILAPESNPALFNAVLTPENVGKLLHVKTKTLRNWRYQRVGPKYVKVGRGVVYLFSDVSEYLQARTVSTKPIAPPRRRKSRKIA